MDDETGFFYLVIATIVLRLVVGHTRSSCFADGPNLYAYVHNAINLIRSLGLAAHPVDRDRAQGRQSGRWVKYVFNAMRVAAKTFCSKCCHDVWEEARPIVSFRIPGQGTLDRFTNCSSTPTRSPEEQMAGGHKWIDRAFHTNMANDYTPEAIQARAESISCCVMPAPPALSSSTKGLSNFSIRYPSNTAQTQKINVAAKPLFQEVVTPDKTFSGFTISELLQAGQQMDRGGLTKAGRALQKHGGRPNSVFPNPKGSMSQINQQGQQILGDILHHPEVVSRQRHLQRFGEVIDIETPGSWRGAVQYQRIIYWILTTKIELNGNAKF